MQDSKPILLVDGNELDAVTIKEALKGLNVPLPVKHCKNATEALGYFKDASHPKPCLVLLNPCNTGLSQSDFLEHVKADHALCTVPIVVLADTKDNNLVGSCFNRGIAGFVLKPQVYDELKKALHIIIQY